MKAVVSLSALFSCIMLYAWYSISYGPLLLAVNDLKAQVNHLHHEKRNAGIARHELYGLQYRIDQLKNTLRNSYASTPKTLASAMALFSKIARRHNIHITSIQSAKENRFIVKAHADFIDYMNLLHNCQKALVFSIDQAKFQRNGSKITVELIVCFTTFEELA